MALTRRARRSNCSGRTSLRDRRTILSIPEAKEARAIPLGAGDSEGDLGQAVIGLAAPGKAIRQHHHPLWPPIPFPDQLPGLSSVRFWSKLARRADMAAPASFAIARSST